MYCCVKLDHCSLSIKGKKYYKLDSVCCIVTDSSEGDDIVVDSDEVLSFFIQNKSSFYLKPVKKTHNREENQDNNDVTHTGIGNYRKETEETTAIVETDRNYEVCMVQDEEILEVCTVSSILSTNTDEEVCTLSTT